MKNFFYSLLGVLLVGALLSGIVMLSEYKRLEYERETTVTSTRFEIVVRSGTIEKDLKVSIPGHGASTPYYLRIGLEKRLYLDFSKEPAIRDFAEANLGEYVRIDGLKKVLVSEAVTGGRNELVVVEVLKLKVLKPRR